MIKPYLKFTGSKSDIINPVLDALGDLEGRTFVDVFGGSGCVSLNVKNKYKDKVEVVYNDFSSPLVNLHKHIVSDHRSLYFYARELWDTWLSLPTQEERKAFYVDVREDFNECLMNNGCSNKQADLLLFLNRTCFNGLYRFNQKGGFNVPVGDYKTLYKPSLEMKQFSILMKDVKFHNLDFTEMFKLIPDGAVAYHDVPYSGMNEPEGHTTFNYTEETFTPNHQRMVVELAKDACNRGIKSVISNSFTPFTEELYNDATELRYVTARRSVSSDKGTRGDVKEILAIYQ